MRGDLSQRQYFENLQQSVFTLCPTGNGDETYRVAEALNSGSIPILVHSYYTKRWLSDAPFVMLDSWKGINERISTLLANATHLNQLQERVVRWWHDYINELQAQIAADVLGPTPQQ